MIKYKGKILVHTKKGFLPKTVQKFQTKLYPEAGRWNHSMDWFEINSKDWVFEASVKECGENKGKFKNAGAYFNPMDIYSGDKYELLWLKPKFEVNHEAYLDAALCLEGTPYDVGNLVFHQIAYYTTEKWIGRKLYKSTNTMVCHELSMNLTNIAEGYNVFERPHMAQIIDIHGCYLYEHLEL